MSRQNPSTNPLSADYVERVVLAMQRDAASALFSYQRAVADYLMGPEGIDHGTADLAKVNAELAWAEARVGWRLPVPSNVRHFLARPARRGSVRAYVQATVFYCRGQLGIGALLDVAERFSRAIEARSDIFHLYFFAEANLALRAMSETLPEASDQVRAALRDAWREGLVRPQQHAPLVDGLLGELLYR